MRRLILLAIVAFGVAPGTWLRTDTTSRDFNAPIELKKLDTREGLSGPLALSGAWVIDSRNDHFGGYSALVALGPDRLLAGSDRGRLLEIALAAGDPVVENARMSFVPGRAEAIRTESDLEALTYDADSGLLWAAFEYSNLVERIAPDGSVVRHRPAAMRNWSDNGGAETLVRLPDGQFLMLAESPEDYGLDDYPGLLFAGDPAEGSESIEFRFATTPGFRPVDATLLPDGDVLILTRRVRFGLPAIFDTMLVRADPATIVTGEVWRGKVLQKIAGKTFGENLEGVAFVAQPGNPNAGSIYLIADDNLSIFQKTLFMRFVWPPAEPAVKAERRQTDK